MPSSPTLLKRYGYSSRTIINDVYGYGPDRTFKLKVEHYSR